jgi:hypothetical protein
MERRYFKSVIKYQFTVTPAKAGVQKDMKKTGFLLPQERHPNDRKDFFSSFLEM